MTEIRGARTLVVGATGALGAAIVRALHQEGARVVGTGRDASRLEALAGVVEGGPASPSGHCPAPRPGCQRGTT